MKSAFSRPVYLRSAFRTPIGAFGGALHQYSAPELASLALKGAIDRTPDSNGPGRVYLGHARQAGAGPNPARQATVGAGLSESIPALTLNQACASGLASVIAAADQIASGRIDSAWAGGVEAMSQTPYLLTEARWGQRLGHSKALDAMYRDGFFCPMAGMVMGETVETFLAKELGIERAAQDEFALRSQSKAEAAKAERSAEIIPVPAGEGRSAKVRPGLDHDEHARPQTTLEKLGTLKPGFDPKSGSVTAGNSSGITDGAAWTYLSADSEGAWLEILDYEVVAIDPKRMGLGPVPSTQALLKRQGLNVEDLERVELNEAFAAQVLACQLDLKIPEEKLNTWGGAIALGHPIGMTGSRLVTTLAHQLKGKSGALGLATLCVSGGQGVALLVRAV